MGSACLPINATKTRPFGRPHYGTQQEELKMPFTFVPMSMSREQDHRTPFPYETATDGARLDGSDATRS